MIINDEGRLYRCGGIKRLDSYNEEFKLIESVKDKVRLVAVGKSNITVVTEDNSIYRYGFSKEGHLG